MRAAQHSVSATHSSRREVSVARTEGKVAELEPSRLFVRYLQKCKRACQRISRVLNEQVSRKMDERSALRPSRLSPDSSKQASRRVSG